jgi:hypothetical protein
MRAFFAPADAPLNEVLTQAEREASKAALASRIEEVKKDNERKALLVTDFSNINVKILHDS